MRMWILISALLLGSLVFSQGKMETAASKVFMKKEMMKKKFHRHQKLIKAKPYFLSSDRRICAGCKKKHMKRLSG